MQIVPANPTQSWLSPVEQALLKIALLVLNSVPVDAQAQLSADLGILLGNAAAPMEQAAIQEILDAIRDTAEFSRPTADFDAQFDELRGQNADGVHP